MLDVDQASLGLDLQLGLFRDDQREILFEFRRRSVRIQNGSGHINAIVCLFRLDANLVGELRSANDDFLGLGRLHFDAAIGDVLNRNDGAALDGEAFFEFLAGCKRGCGKQQNSHAKHRQHVTVPFCG